MQRWLLKRFVRSFNSGQPLHESHPHLLKKGELWPKISAAEFKARRKRLLDLIPEDDATVVLKAAPVRYASQNIFYRYQQESDFLYLTAWNEPDAAVVLEKSRGGDGGGKMVMFVDAQGQESKLWEGERNGPERAKSVFGADVVHKYSELGEYMRSAKGKVYNADDVRGRVHSLRVVKSPGEIELMREAGRIAKEAFQAMGSPHLVKEESAVEALLEYECRKRGAQGLAYVPVVAGGLRGLVIHYTRNDQLLHSSQGVLIDAGCRYHGYCSDVTRSYPPLSGNSNISSSISGGVAAWQKVYDAVERVQRVCLAALSHPGEHRTLMSMNLLAMHMFTEELGRLGFRDASRCVQELFPHSIGHYLGMDVHDCASVSTERELEAGMVITIEPGLYVPASEAYPREYWGVAVRIEDDVLITRDGIEVLTN